MAFPKFRAFDVKDDTGLRWLQPRWGGWRRVLMRDACPYCFGPSNSVDHVFTKRERKRRVHYDIDDIVGACKQCNHDRGPIPLVIYLAIRQLQRPGLKKAAATYWNPPAPLQ
jgi:5-methylcytosine-specific restriction endonuclease McrA